MGKKNKFVFPTLLIVLLAILSSFILILITFNLSPSYSEGCDKEFSSKCGEECFSCGGGYNLCCVDEEKNWCCPNGVECDYEHETCQDDYESGIKSMKDTIVWVKYEITGKNLDGTYFETEGSGSGILYTYDDESYYIFTNRHVIDYSYGEENYFQRITEKITVRTPDGKLHDVKRILYSPHGLDIAVLKIDRLNYNYSLAPVNGGIELGDSVIAIGYPSFTYKVLEFTTATGKVTNFRDLLMDDGFSFSAIESDAYTYFGSSGGGLFDEYGNLIGINTWVAEYDASFAIKINIINNFESYEYCDKGYFTEEGCIKYCDRDEILGYDFRCHNLCEDYYCESNRPDVYDVRCEDTSNILGEDGYCHPPCGSKSTYCDDLNSICFEDNCYAFSFEGKYLWEDGTYRYYN